MVVNGHIGLFEGFISAKCFKCPLLPTFQNKLFSKVNFHFSLALTPAIHLTSMQYMYLQLYSCVCVSVCMYLCIYVYMYVYVCICVCRKNNILCWCCGVNEHGECSGISCQDPHLLPQYSTHNAKTTKDYNFVEIQHSML